MLLASENIISRVPDKLNYKFNIEIKDLNIENISKSDSEKLYKERTVSFIEQSI